MRIQVDDGATLEFPDDADEAEIDAGVNEYLAEQPPVDTSQPDEPSGRNLQDLITGKSPDVNMVEDIAQSTASGLAEGVAAATPLGMGLNIVRGISDLSRWGAKKIYEGVYDEEMPQGNPNPIPTSSEALQYILKPSGLPGMEKEGIDLYEPQTRAGKFAKTAASFGGGGVATGVPLSTSIPAAVVSEGAGQATEGTDWEIPARLAGAVVGGYGANKFKDARAAKANTVTSADIKRIANEKYALADERGGILKPEVINKWVDEIDDIAPQTDQGKLLAGDSAFTKTSDIVKQYRGQHLTLKAAEEIDEILTDKIDDFFVDGRLKAQGQKLLEVQNKFRKTILDADESSVLGGKEGFNALKDGRQAWADAMKLRDLERIIMRAEMMDNPATGIKTGFRTLASNPSRLRGYSKEEVALINKAAKTGVVTDLLRTFGSRLIPAITAGSGGGLPASAAAAAAGMASRDAATRLQVGRATKLTDKITSKYKEPVPSSTRKLTDTIKRLEVKPLRRIEARP